MFAFPLLPMRTTALAHKTCPSKAFVRRRHKCRHASYCSPRGVTNLKPYRFSRTPKEEVCSEHARGRHGQLNDVSA